MNELFYTGMEDKGLVRFHPLYSFRAMEYISSLNFLSFYSIVYFYFTPV
jgi:hypothetical protein